MVVKNWEEYLSLEGSPSEELGMPAPYWTQLEKLQGPMELFRARAGGLGQLLPGVKAKAGITAALLAGSGWHQSALH